MLRDYVPKIRMQLHPEDFIEKSSGATLNYYIDGKSTLNPEYALSILESRLE